MDFPAASPAVSARDVINADAIRAAIARRSLQRRDHADIARWLRSHFYRWAINRFAHVLPVRSVENWRVCVGAQAPPPWFLRKLADGGAAMIYIDPEHNLLRERENRMVEFFNARLHSRLAGKFHRIAFDAADAAWQRDHERMQRRSGRGWWPSQPHALSETVATPNGRFVELRGSGQTLRAELAYESFHMQHCLGQFADRERLQGGYGEQYARGCEQGRTRLFSLRDGNNRPHVTVSLVEDLGEWSLDQIKGKQNTVPAAKYAADVLCLLNAVRPRDAGSQDMLRLGIVAREQDGEAVYAGFAELDDPARRHALLGAAPQLLRQYPRPDAFVQWLALGAGAAVLDEVDAPHGPVLAALQAMQPDADAHEPSAPPRERLAEALARHFPQWLAAPADAARDETPSSGGWLRRLLSKSPPTAADLARPHRQWALAVGEPLLFRLGLDGGIARTRLAAPAGVPQRVRDQVEAELAAGYEDAEVAIREFRAGFFRIPHLAHEGLLEARQAPGEDLARDLLAWHAMRQSYALRLLVGWGRIDEAQAWPLALLNAQRVQDGFGSWPEFGAAAVRGHAASLRWSGREARHAKATEVALQDFQEQFGCPWQRLSWSAFDLAQALAAPSVRAEL
ncbi:DUF1266 domain-containing protein [Lysobacter sp. K5869]|uniref:DUF1266 domain-containing protein n=1 Tax=Lysobacter sp. K5869 TaxID=2820808 RepID=UPI001C060539|nr:DUF1266 domain-containing protein [Lysobacter sp. K5869]QWP76143.1 DUF1266 domain-containing protein [Lysobacter sp. K5869]